MGAVYRARDLHFPKLMKLVAVKEMVNQNRDPSIQRTVVQNFEREANILATLNHPAIPRTLDYFSQGERSYLVMEFVNGRNLEDILHENGGPIQHDQVINWALELCDVLAYLHSHKPEPVIFRDMKPANVMLNQAGQLMLVDFGIAKHFQTGQRGTQVGTEGYSPPEQYRGDATPLADIYALGATMHHLLTNIDPRMEAPFSFGDRPVRSINPGVSMELEAVINTALQYNPDDRFKNVDAMREALLTVAKRTGVLTRYTLGSPTASISLDSASVKPLWIFTCEDEIRGSPGFHAGTVYVGCYDNNLYAVQAGSGELIWKYPTDGGIVSKPAVLDNRVYFGSQDGRLHVISTKSGKVVWTYPTEAPIFSSPKISDGHVFVGSDDYYLHAINIAGARRAWRLDAGGPIRSTPCVSNTGVFFGTENGEFVKVDFGGKELWRFRAKRAITSSPACENNSIFFTSLDWTLYCLDADNGWVLWRYRLGKPSISSPAVADHYVIVGAVDGYIYCVDARTGKEIWKYKTENQVTGSPTIYRDAVYCGSVDGNLYCIEYRSGRLKWKFKTEGSITGAPTIFDDVVYLGSTDHKLYALLA
jgi:outer membrane protein assembly factor BamB/tRNA A-37 threonylcarbamoyl transferase component Bud32